MVPDEEPQIKYGRAHWRNVAKVLKARKRKAIRDAVTARKHATTKWKKRRKK